MSFLDFVWLAVFVPLIPLGITVSRRLFGHWFTPLSIFVGINSLSMSCYHLRLLEMPDATLQVHLLLLISFAAFFVGTILAVGGRTPDALRAPDRPWNGAGLGAFFYATVTLSTLGWLIQGYLLVGRMGLGALINNIWVLQGEFQIQFVGYLNMIGILVFPTFVLRRLLGQGRKIDFLLLGSALFGLLLAGIKGYMVFSLLGGAYIMSAVRPDLFRMRHLVTGMAVILGFFIFYVANVDIFSQETYTGVGIMKHLPALHMPYLYFVGSWPSLGFIMDGTVGPLPRLGSFVLEPVWKLLGFAGLVDHATLYQPFVNFQNFTFNVYSLVGELYWDVKWPGTLLVVFLLGVFTTRMYLRVRTSDYWGHAMVYVVAVHGLFISFFSFIYTFSFYLMLVYVFVAGFVLPRGGILVDRGRDR